MSEPKKRPFPDESGVNVESSTKKSVNTEINPWNGRLWSANYKKLLEDRKKLPIWNFLNEIDEQIKKNQIVILEGETGSGKSTQIPHHMALSASQDPKSRMIACTQPRRVSAISVARRVAREMDCQIGSTIGYSVRFEDNTSHQTKLKFCTDGILLREAINDPYLMKYSMIILDEAHERTVNTDILMGILKNILETRTDLKVIVMSATVDQHRFQSFFNDAPLLTVPGRLYPVEITYCNRLTKDYVNDAISEVIKIHKTNIPGDVLVFLTGESEINDALKYLGKRIDPKLPALKALPLHSTLPMTQQENVFESYFDESGYPIRKVIFATNIAETSLTIDGIVHVIDCGFSKIKTFSARLRVDALTIAPISKANASQRAGRAGRTGPGKCIRLYSEKAFDRMEAFPAPEVRRCDMSSVCLSLLKLGMTDLVHFDWMDPPHPETLMRALDDLHHLGAIDAESGELTEIGVNMAQFPVSPTLSRSIIASCFLGCAQEVISLAAILSEPGFVIRPNGKTRYADEAHEQFRHVKGDHLTLLNMFHAFLQNGCRRDWAENHFLHYFKLNRVVSIRQQLERIAARINLNLVSQQPSPAHYDHIKCALVCGYYMNIAYYSDARQCYIAIKDNQEVTIHPSTTLDHRPKWLLYDEMFLSVRTYIRNCTEIKPEWLIMYAPMYFNPSLMVEGEPKWELTRIRDTLAIVTSQQQQQQQQQQPQPQ
eukprot:TRINITY_DN496_c1_g1_i1.p1 TRINITY_DN496_c1_g1~~TRINITY_DN496_c1_g1_i1.p1  ORF type:complete len:734 (-),score=186.24 TRINITY_DN496_c1_g1_i1:300-2441(-)